MIHAYTFEHKHIVEHIYTYIYIHIIQTYIYYAERKRNTELIFCKKYIKVYTVILREII